MRPYQYCCKEECIERQGLGQVSSLEATLETCELDQAHRVLDTCLAVSKYRRSAAGGNDDRRLRTKDQLQSTLSHLIQICSTLKASPDHPPIQNLQTIVQFVVDRVRACQSDATRLLSNTLTCVPSSWHAKVIRLLIWLRYNCCETKDDADATARTIDHMRSTAYDAYWSTSDGTYDDEMLCYHAISRMCAVVQHSSSNYATGLETSWNGITLEYEKRKLPNRTYPLWNLALTIASHVRREEYYVLWKTNHNVTKNLPILAKSILSGELLLFARYRTVEHYNKSFGKAESVSDMNRLLGIANGWSFEYANVFGVPVEETRNNGIDTTTSTSSTITMKLKQVAMPDFNSIRIDTTTMSRIRDSDRPWTFGDNFDDASTLGMSPKVICGLLQFGSGPSVRIDSMSELAENDPVPRMSSLSRALQRTFSASDKDNPLRTRASPIQKAIHRVHQNDKPCRLVPNNSNGQKKKNGKKKREKKPPPCRFFSTGMGCKFGDKCRFDHTL